MLSHHGTRGQAVLTMAPRDRDEPWNVVDRRGDPVTIPGEDSWLCVPCTAKKPDNGMQYWVRSHLDTCRCGQKRPHNPRRFRNSLVGKATARAPKPGTAAAPKAGPSGVAADTKRNRDDQRKIAELEKKAADLEKKLKEKEKSPERDDEEFQDANEGGDDEAEGTKEEWQQEVDDERALLATRRKELKEAKWPAAKARLEKAIEEHVERVAELTKLIHSAQSPQEQLQKKTAKSKRLSDSLPGILQQTREVQTAKLEAQELLDKHTAKEIELLDLYQDRKEEIARLNKETTEVCHERLGQAPTADQWMEREMDEKLKIFDDPSWNGDTTVTEKKALLQTAAGNFRKNWAEFQAGLDFLVKHAADEKKRKAAEDAKTTAEATRKADEQALEAKKVENEQRRKLEEDAKAAKKADVERKKKEDEEAKAAKEAEAVAANPPKDGPVRDRTRSPSNAKVGKDRPQLPKNVSDALAKRPSERSDAETLLAASEAKASRRSKEGKEDWADAADEMQDDAQA